MVANWTPARTLETGRELAFAYRIKAMAHGGGKVINIFGAPTRASGEPAPPTSAAPLEARRLLTDFNGGNLAGHLLNPSLVEVVASTSAGTIASTSLVLDPHTDGSRAALVAGWATDLRAFPRSGERALTETWSYPWVG